jgi:Kef-type K+ transport system membrane component KefB
MNSSYWRRENLTSYFFAFIILVLVCFWLKSFHVESSWQHAGLLNLSVGALMLAAHIIARTLKTFRLPLISGYIFTGILAGPYVSGFLSFDMVQKMGLINDLALSFIGLAAGGSLHVELLKKRIRPITFNIVFQAIIIFTTVFLFVQYFGHLYSFTQAVTTVQLTALAIILGATAVARSPSSAIAVINECKAKGPLSETVLSVTVAIDVLIIILFTIAMTVVRFLFVQSVESFHGAFFVLLIEIGLSVFAGIVVGKGISFFIEHIQDHLPLFLFFLAFGIARFSLAMSFIMEKYLGFSIHLEPLLICMSAGFVVQNFTPSGFFFKDSLKKIEIPIYVLFFSVTGSSLNIQALSVTWPLALSLVGIRIFGIFAGVGLAGILSGDLLKYTRIAWMCYITQAGVTIGLAQLAYRQFPEIALYISTVVLAIVLVNEIIGPIALKVALHLAGEADKE